MYKTADCQDTQETQTSRGQQLGSADVHQDGFDSKPVTLRPWPLVRLPLPAHAAAGSCPWCCHALSRINEHMPPRYCWRLPCTPAHKSCDREKQEIGASLVGTPPVSLYASSCLKGGRAQRSTGALPRRVSMSHLHVRHLANLAVFATSLMRPPSFLRCLHAAAQVHGEAAAARDCAPPPQAV